MTAAHRLHGADADIGDLPARATAWVADRLAHSPVGRVGDPRALVAALDGGIADEGLGIDDAWRRFTDIVAPANVGLDSERFLAFIPMSPSAASVWMDAVVSAASFSAESWLEAAGAVAAEAEVIDLLVRAAGLPDGAGGCFMSGGSIGNLSALAVARDQAPDRRVVAVADTAHTSVRNALHLLGMEALVVPTGADSRLTAAALRAAFGDRRDIATIVASGGSTNGGVIDDLAGCADVAAEVGAWLHVDGAYGLAAMLLPELRQRFAGIERADSFIVDPHKWLFATAGSCALVYRRPDLARAVHTQAGPYIEVLHTDDDVYNPCDLGFQLTRRASGLPLWFALSLHGLEAHRRAIRAGIHLATAFADALHRCPLAEPLLSPELSVVLFRRHGWSAPDWQRWAADLLARQVAFVAPSTFRGESVGRVVFLHPLTPPSIVDELIDSLGR
jgi:aromatic-L-amino-acid decarboxylase